MRYLGLDYGSKKIGIALSDENGTMGFPYAIVANTSRVLEDLCALVKREKVGVVVIGESRDLDGTDNTIAKDARYLGVQLAERSGVSIEYESEVFTSEEARQAPHKFRRTRAPKGRRPVDDSAAALILTAYLSRISHA